MYAWYVSLLEPQKNKIKNNARLIKVKIRVSIGLNGRQGKRMVESTW